MLDKTMANKTHPKSPKHNRKFPNLIILDILFAYVSKYTTEAWKCVAILMSVYESHK